MKKKLKQNPVFKNIIVAVFAIVVYFIFGVMSFPNKDTIDNFNAIYYILFALFTTLVMIFLYFEELKKEIKEFFKHPIKNILICLGTFIVSFIIVILLNSIIDSAFGWEKVNSDSLIFPNMKSLLYYTVFVMVLYTPFVESMVFDKALHKIFKNKILFVILSGVLFGIMQVGLDFNNLTSLVYSVPYMFLGIIISALYAKKQNVFFPIFTWVIYYSVQVFIQYMAL